jgi:hypothetical protein
MSNEFKKECGVGYYWCNTDKVCKPIQEDAPTMAAGNGAIAGIGVGPQGEPGVKKRKIASFISFMRRGQNASIKESVVYKKPDHNRLAGEEHGENIHQSNAIKSGQMTDVHPAIASAIHKFANDHKSFTSSLQKSKIEKIKHGTNVGNSEIGHGVDAVENKDKVNRVKSQMKPSGGGIDRPIVLRHTDKQGQTHHHLLAGNTRATTVGYGVEAHHIDV